MSHQYEPFASRRTFKSKFTEFQIAEWRRRRNNVFVTGETVVPTMPKKPLEEPDDAQYHLSVAVFDEQIEELQETFEELKAEQHETRSIMKDGQHGRNPIQMELKELFGELSQYSQEKKERLNEIEVLNQKMQVLDRDLQKQRKNVHPVYNEEAKLESGVKELEHRLCTHAWGK